MTITNDAQGPVAGWRYSINYGPDGEENFANVYAADGQFVGNLRAHHAIAICNAFAVCEKLDSAPAPASGGVDAVADFPMGAIENGRALADRLEMTGLECPAGDLRMCSDWQEFRRCFEYLAEWALPRASLVDNALPDDVEARSAVERELDRLGYNDSNTNVVLKLAEFLKSVKL